MCIPDTTLDKSSERYIFVLEYQITMYLKVKTLKKSCCVSSSSEAKDDCKNVLRSFYRSALVAASTCGCLNIRDLPHRPFFREKLWNILDVLCINIKKNCFILLNWFFYLELLYCIKLVYKYGGSFEKGISNRLANSKNLQYWNSYDKRGHLKFSGKTKGIHK